MSKMAKKNQHKPLFSKAKFWCKLCLLWMPSNASFLIKGCIYFSRTFNFIIFGIFIQISLVTGMYLLHEEGDTSNILDHMSMVVGFGTFQYKTIFLWWNQKSIEKLMHILNNHRYINRDSKDVIYYLSIIRKAYIGGLLGMWITVLFYLGAPAIGTNGRLPIKTLVTYGLDPSKTLQFTIISFFQVLGPFVNATTGMVYDFLYCEILLMTAAIAKEIREEMKNSLKPYNGSLATLRINEIALGFYSQKIQELLQLCNEINSTYLVAHIIHFIYNYTLIAQILYQVSLQDFGSIRHISMVTCVLCVLLTLALYCDFGQRVTNEITEIWEALYFSDWYDQSKNYKQIILFSLIKSQKQVVFSAGSIMTLSRETLKTVLTNSMTYYTFLMNIRE